MAVFAAASLSVGSLRAQGLTSSGAGVRLKYDLRYRPGNARACTLDLALPPSRFSGPRPGIVVIHGGGWIEGDKSSFDRPAVHNPADIRDFAARGFVTAAINYRLSKEAPYPAALYDCQCAVRWLRAHAKEFELDAKRVGAYGNSAGGHLAMLLALIDPSDRIDERNAPYSEQSSRVQAAVSDSGPIDLLSQVREGRLTSVVQRFLGGPPVAARLATYKQASPESYTTRRPPPLLLIYGEADEQVDVRTADRFVAALSLSGDSEISYIRLASVGHCPHSLVGVPWLRSAVNEFFSRVLAHR